MILIYVSMAAVLIGCAVLAIAMDIRTGWDQLNDVELDEDDEVTA